MLRYTFMSYISLKSLFLLQFPKMTTFQIVWQHASLLVSMFRLLCLYKNKPILKKTLFSNKSDNQFSACTPQLKLYLHKHQIQK